VASVNRGVNTVGGVIIQFPFYAGIFGMIKFSGLTGIIAAFFVNISTADTYPLINFFYTGLITMFVPSAGSKFAIEAPYIIPAAQALGTPIPYIVNSYGLSHGWAAMVQPFWALPVLGAFKLKFRDILPYSFIILVVTGAIMCFGIYFFPLWF
jgi:short-chain fatty acids transporter